MATTFYNEFFDDWRRRPPAHNAAQTRELPNREIEVRIGLNLSDVPSELINELSNKLNTQNMDLTQPNSSSDIVIISGIPPDHGFGPQQVLQIVKERAPDAQILA